MYRVVYTRRRMSELATVPDAVVERHQCTIGAATFERGRDYFVLRLPDAQPLQVKEALAAVLARADAAGVPLEVFTITECVESW